MKDFLPNLVQHTRPTGTFVTIRSRDDIDPSSDSFSVEHSGRSVTAVPENVGLCQIVDVGPDVTNVKPGDICFIDFFDVAQAYVVASETLYLTQAMALRMTCDIKTELFLDPITRTQKQRVLSCDVTPLPGYVLTKHAPERMTVAVTGCNRLILPRNLTTSGLVGGRSADGDPCTYVCYEEVVKATPGAIQQERYVEDWQGRRHDTYYEERRLKATIQKLEAVIRRLSVLDLPGPVAADSWSLEIGALVVFCSEFSIQFRAMGELFRCVPYKNILSEVDDRAILAEYLALHPEPPLVQLLGGGGALLYGT
jgi:hypothetical protein